MCSPVTGLFIGLGLFATFLVRPTTAARSLIGGACPATLMFVALVFATPGPQPYTVASALLTAGSALVLLLARPNQVVRVVIWITVLAAPLVATIPNGLGSNVVRLPWICLPAVVVATRHRPAQMAGRGGGPAGPGALRERHRRRHRPGEHPSAAPSYYTGLIRQL